MPVVLSTRDRAVNQKIPVPLCPQEPYLPVEMTSINSQISLPRLKLDETETVTKWEVVKKGLSDKVISEQRSERSEELAVWIMFQLSRNKDLQESMQRHAQEWQESRSSKE